MKQLWNLTSSDSQIDADLQLMRVSRYHSIIISKNCGSILLIVYLVTAILLTRDSVPAFYVLAANNFLPFLLSLVLKQDHSEKSSNGQTVKKEAKESSLPLFCKKYNYTYLKYRCSSLSFMFVFLLLFLWQRRELKHPAGLLSFVPTVILLVMFILRTCGNIYYRRKFHQMLLDCDY